jgi:predicted MFS family arabinose efflux permease
MLEILQGLFSLVGTEIVRRNIHLNKPSASARTLFVIYSLLAAALLVFVFTDRFGLAMAAWVLVSGFQDISRPIMETWLNLNIPSTVRATIISMYSQTGVVGTLGSSTGLGAFGDRFGVRNALGLSGIILLPIILIFSQKTKILTLPEKA